MRQRRLLPEALEVGRRASPAEPRRPQRALVAVGGRRDLVAHAVGRHGGAEAVALADQPVRHEAAVGEARDAEARRDRRAPPPPPSRRRRADPRRRRRPSRRGSPPARRGRSSPSRAGRASARAHRRPRAPSRGATARGPSSHPGPPMIESTSGSALRPAPRGAATVARIGPAGPGIETCSQAIARQRPLPGRAVARQPAPAAGLLEVELDDAGGRRAQRDDAPAAAPRSRARAARTRPARRARPPAGKRQSALCPASVSGAITASAPSQVSASLASTSQSTRSLEPVTYRCRWRPCARSRGLPPPAGTTQSESSQPYGSPASSMPRKATCAPSGDQETNLHEPARRASSRRLSAARRHDVHGRRGPRGRRARRDRRRTRCACRRATRRSSRPTSRRASGAARGHRPARPGRRGACAGRR